jgi:hypothetical protein
LRKTYPLLLAGLVVVAIVAPMAQGTGSADRLSALEKKVKVLTARVTTLESQAAATKGDVASAKSEIANVQGKVTALETGGAALQSAVTALQSSVGSLTTGLQCVRYKAMGIARYQGYVYTNDAGKTFGATTALDATDQGETPTVFAALVNPSCVSAAFVVRPAAQIQRDTTAFHTR